MNSQTALLTKTITYPLSEASQALADLSAGQCSLALQFPEP